MTTQAERIDALAKLRVDCWNATRQMAPRSAEYNEAMYMYLALSAVWDRDSSLFEAAMDWRKLVPSI